MVDPCTGRAMVVVVVGTEGWGRGCKEGWGRDAAAAPGFLALSAPGMQHAPSASAPRLSQLIPARRQLRHLLRLDHLSPGQVLGLGPATRQADSSTCSVCSCDCLSVFVSFLSFFLFSLIAHVRAMFAATQFNTHLLFAGNSMQMRYNDRGCPPIPLPTPTPC